MFKRTLSLLLVLCMVFTMAPSVFATDTTTAVGDTVVSDSDQITSTDDSGETTEADLTIGTAYDLVAFANAVTAGDKFAGKIVKLSSNIDLSGIEWAPIGGDNVYFAGEFDGAGYIISNLTQTEGARMGLFGLVEKAYIHDVTLQNVSFTIDTDNARVGAIAGNLQYWNVVEDVTIDGINIVADANDGLIGAVAGYVWKSQLGNVDVKNAEITVNGTGNVVAGHTGYGRAHVWDTGVTGNNAHWLDGTVQIINGTEYVLQNYFVDCDIDGIKMILNGTGTEAGGFFGSDTYNSHSNYFVNCHVTGLDVTAAEGTSQIVGGFIAWNNGTTTAGTVKGFDGCSVTGTIDGANGTYGGFVGQVGGRSCQYDNATANVDITCTGTAGGFVGITQQYFTHKLTFTNCVATGDVTANIAGGFAGKNGLGGDGDNINVEFNGCSASGNVSGTTYAGGFIGTVDTELPATNWSITEGAGNLTLISNTAATNVTVAEGGKAGLLIGYLDGVANSDASEGNTLKVTLINNNVDSSGINTSDDTIASDIDTLDPVAMIGSTVYDTLASAVEAANAVTDGATITLYKDVTLGEKLTITGNVTIKGGKITRDDAYTGTLFAVNAGATLTLDGGLVIDGGNEYAFDTETYTTDLNAFESVSESAKYFTPEEGAPVATAYMITTTGGTVNLNNVTIKNNYSTNGSGIVSAGSGATVNLTGAQITHNANVNGSGLVVNASSGKWDTTPAIWVNMNEGTVIAGNHVGGNHGVFKVYMGTVFTMNGGVIMNTTGWNSNGVAIGIYWATVVMNGGEICSNSSVYGPNNGRNAAVYVHNSSSFTMNGGTVCHNAAALRGSVDSPKSSSTTVINGGSIVNNYSVEGAGSPNADVYGIDTTTIYGGTFTQDVTQWLAPDLGLVYDEESGTYGLTKDLYEYNGIAYNSLAEVITAIEGTPATLDDESTTPVVKVLASHKVDDATVIGTDLVLDLNGMTITGAKNADGVQVYPVIRVQGGANVTVKNGTITNADYVFVLGASDSSSAGNLTIESGKYHGATTVASVTKGTLTINGGEFSVDPYVASEGAEDNYEFTLNCIDTNYKDGSAKIVVNGGKFYKFDPSNNAAEGAGTSFITEDYISVAEGDYYTVEFNEVAKIGETVYSSLAAAVNAAEAGDEIVILKGTEITAPVVIEKNVTIDLNGMTLTGVDVYPVIRVQNGANVTVKNGTITNDDYVFVLGASDASSAGYLTIESGTYTGVTTVASVTKGTLTVLGGNFAVSNDDATYLLNCIDKYYNDDTANIVVKGGSFKGFNPADNEAETGDHINFCAKYYTTSVADGVYTVVVADTLEIWNKADLLEFAAIANADNKFSGKTVMLMADIDFEWADWKPVTFAGTFEGGNHTIKNLTYVTKSATGTQMGFFNSLSGTAKNLTIDGVKATLVEGGKLGGVARLLNGTAENVHIKNITVDVPGKIDWFIGGFAGYAYGYATNCSVENFTVNAPNATGEPCIGGFIGSICNSATFTNCDVKNFKATIHCTDGLGLGGFTPHTQTGWHAPNFVDCDVTGIDFTVSGLVDVAGFVTWPGAHTDATNCTTEGKIDVTGVTSGGCLAGGFLGQLGWNCDLGQMGHVITNCSADVDIITKLADAGGFVGSATNSNDWSMYATFNNCTASGDITAIEGATADIGGFFGDGDRGVYNSCSASGTVTNNGTGYEGQFGGALYDVTPKYDHRYPAGTRAYLVDEITLDNCTYTGTSELKFIGNIQEGTTVTIKEYVAQIGEINYYTIQEAIDAAVAGDTVKLLKDVAITESLVVADDDDIIIDLNGKNLTNEIPAEATTFHTIINNGTLEITDFVGTGKIQSNSAKGYVIYTEGGSLVAYKVKIVGINNGYAVVTWTDGDNITIEDGTVIEGRGALYIDGGAKGEVKGGIFTMTVQTTNNQDNVVYVGGTSELTINGGTFSTGEITGAQRIAIAALNTSKVTINGGTFYGLTGDVQAKNTCTVSINGGTFTGTKMDERTTDSISIKGGTYSYDPTEWCADTYEPVNNGDGTWSVKREDVVAELWAPAIGGYMLRMDVYESQDLAEVYAYYTDTYLGTKNWRIELLADVNATDLTIVDGFKTTINLNGKTINGNIVVETGATATISGGSIINTNSSVSAVQSTGTLTLNDVNIESARHAVRVEGGEATINGGIYKVSGTANMTTHVVNVSDGAVVTINGGEFIGPKGLVSDSGSAVNVQESSTVSITGGKFTGGKNSTLASKGTLTLTGGFYDQDPNAYCAAEYAGIYDEETKLWEVVNYVEWIKAELLAGNDVTLIKDVVVDGSDIDSIHAATNSNGVYFNPGIFNVVGGYGDGEVTFDLNGYTITYNGHVDADYDGTKYASNYPDGKVNSCNIAHGLFFANNGGKLTVVDGSEDKTGTVMVYGLASGVYAASPDSVITVEGGTWKNEGCQECGGTNLFLYASHGGELYIKGGHFDQALDANGASYLIVEHGGQYSNSVIDFSKTKVEISGGTFVGMNPEEAIFIDQGNGQAISTTNAVSEGYCSVELEEGVWGIITAVAHNVQQNKGYATLAEALDEAKSDETVKVLVNTAESILMVPADVTLDLNGQVVDVTYAVVAFGHIIDTASTVGGIKISNDVKVARTSLLPDNEYLPIYDIAEGDEIGCYRFFEYSTTYRSKASGNTSVKFGVQLLFTNSYAYTVLAQSDDVGFDLVMYLTWTDKNIPILYTIESSFIKSYGESVVANPTMSYAITLNVNSIDKLAEDVVISSHIIVDSATGFVANTVTATYTPATSN